ncbi:Pc13g00810 [Penicillium rubens Wisconsin 54-1255]|uniref:Pc13g00810 protein n=1 Tax=Penicillium rubens (strain ATCC 28089 / DSM 1075 / NRRL 1951 / Wisconsin 54-1255) TaxID=500485 RepID=B6H154_PENRW|nr:Pc13g00810 [Penicillium rubens Wisconsin 54-1255]
MAPPPWPPAQPGEHQFWTDPILCEETRARLEHFRSLGWLPPNFKPKTLEGLAVVERYWRKYCIQLNEDYVEYLLLEDQAIYMNFFDWMSKTSRKKLLQRTKNKNTLDVDVFCVTYRHHWVYSKHFRHGSMIIQFATIQLWSAITGTRPGVLLPQKASLAGMPLGKRKGDKAFQSDLPKYVSTDDLPASVCYRDIELFYLKDPDSKRDVLCAIIEFRNLKGRPEGADGTKYFMHGDYQLAYCPINQIVSLAFRDGAFLNTALTPELIWRLRVPKRSQSLPLRWKPEKLDTPLLRRLERTTYGYELHKSLSMTYDSSRQALQELGRDARFEDDIGHYNYRRWTANEVNRNFTSQERQRVLGQSARKEYFHTAPVLEVDRQIKQLLGQSDVDQSDAGSSEDEDWELPAPDYVFPERVRLVENFYGPEAENFDEERLLARRIQVTKDMVALSQLCEPNRRGNRINWDVEDDEIEKSEEPLPAEEESLECPTDICIICCGQSRLSSSNPPPHKFPAKRQDSVRRHLIDSHLAHAHDGISCTWPACHGIAKFTKVTEFLAHAVTVHAYDINIKLHHLPIKPCLTCSDTSSVDSTVESVESGGRSGTDTPASSVGPEMANIDPRLLEPDKPQVTDPLLRRSKRLRLR